MLKDGRVLSLPKESPHPGFISRSRPCLLQEMDVSSLSLVLDIYVTSFINCNFKSLTMKLCWREENKQFWVLESTYVYIICLSVSHVSLSLNFSFPKYVLIDTECPDNWGEKRRERGSVCSPCCWCLPGIHLICNSSLLRRLFRACWFFIKESGSNLLLNSFHLHHPPVVPHYNITNTKESNILALSMGKHLFVL